MLGLLTKFIPDEFKLPIAAGAGVVLGVALCFCPAKWLGAHEADQENRARAAKEALERIQDMENNNAKFRTLSSRDRCLAFMRDSGLRSDVCDQR